MRTSTSSLFGPALAGICLHRVFMLGEIPDQDLITRIIDQIIVPAAMNPVLCQGIQWLTPPEVAPD